MFDLLIKDGTVIDGTGAVAYQASIGVKDGVIREIGALADAQAQETIDGRGLTVTPGFINTHSHSDTVLPFENRGYNILGQGITTEITGHCGDSVIPLSGALVADMKTYLPEDRFREIESMPRDARSVLERLGKSPLGTNVACMVGHGTIRYETMGLEDRPPSAGDMDRMKALLAEAMEAGAYGLTSGLIYPPGVYAREEELIGLAKTAAAYGGVYATHMRNEADRVVESVEEAIRLGERAGLPVLISHHKIAGKQNWGKSAETLARIDRANRMGFTVRCDQYPYRAGATSLMTALPPEFATYGRQEYANKLKDTQFRRTIRGLLLKQDGGFENLVRHSGYDGVLILSAPATPWARGKTLRELADAESREPDDVMFDLLADNAGDVMAAFFSMCEEDIRRILSNQYTMGATDAYYANEFLCGDHPRFTGSFVRILSQYVRGEGLLPLPEAVRKLTKMPAELFGLGSKGVLARGYDADIVVFDYEALRDAADFNNPLAPNEGVKYVLVNGSVALRDDRATGVLAGRILKKR